jgi:hypothetical protein
MPQSPLNYLSDLDVGYSRMGCNLSIFKQLVPLLRDNPRYLIFSKQSWALFLETLYFWLEN